jgi:hypothetical protein
MTMPNREIAPNMKTSSSLLNTLPPQVTSAGNIVLTLPHDKIANLLQTIQNHLQTVDGTPVIQFVSAYNGEGSEVIGFEVAYAAAAQTGKRVLFIDTSARSRFAVLPLANRQAVSLHHLVSDDGLAASPFLSFTGTSFFFTALPENPGGNTLFPPKDTVKNILGDLRGLFDLIIVQTEDAMTTQAATILAGLADATIIVIEAERTRLPVARQLRQIVEDNGGRVIGAVLNKRKLYIWKTIYSLLFKA